MSDKNIIVCHKEDAKNQTETQIDDIIDELLKKHSLSRDDIKAIICTGYGRKKYTKATQISSEILCHARGVNYFSNGINTIIDIGGQDSKIIKLHKNGKVIDFLMNDKCAAGTGRFLEKISVFFESDIITPPLPPLIEGGDPSL